MSSLQKAAPQDIIPELDVGVSRDGDDAVTTHTQSFENVPVKISAVLGKTKIDIAQLRNLEAGSIIDLDRKVGEPIDLYVNERLIARGELVMVDGVLGVTMTEIVKEDDL